MKRSFIYILVVVATIGFVLAKYYLEQDLANVPADFDYNTGKYIEENPDGSFKEIMDSEATPATMVIQNKENDTNKTKYDYVLKISDISGSYKCKKNNEEFYIIFDATGKTTFSLLANETMTIYNVPLEANYSLEQLENKNYKTKIGDKETNISEGTIFEDNTIVFNNINKSSKQYSPDTKDGIKIMFYTLCLSFMIMIILLRLKVERYE